MKYILIIRGKAIYAFIEWGKEYMESQTLGSSKCYYKKYYQCFDMFLDYVDQFLAQYETDRADNTYYHPGLDVDEEKKDENVKETGIKLG